MNLILEGYDEYVKDFEGLRKSTDVLPKTEDEIKEVVEEMLSRRGVDFYDHWTDFLNQEDSCRGRGVGFLFRLETDEEKVNLYVRYQMCG